MKKAKPQAQTNQAPGKPSATRSNKPMVRRDSAILLTIVGLLAGVFIGWQAAVTAINLDAAPGGKPGMPPQAQAQGGQPGQAGGMNSPLMAQAKAAEDKAAKNPNDPAVWYDLGNVYFDAEMPDRAIAAYQKSLALNPGQPNVWTDMGVMLRVQHKPSEAIKAFEQALELDPKHEQARLNIGVVKLFDLEDKAGAIAAWQALLAQDPEARMPDGKRVADMLKEISK